MQEAIEEDSGVAGIVTALVEACKTGISILWALVSAFAPTTNQVKHYSHVLFFALRLGRRDSVEDEVSGVGRRSVVSR